MNVQFALCAQSASVDRTSNRVSIFNVIDHLPVASLPIFLPTVTFVSILECEDQEAVSFKGIFDVTLNEASLTRAEVPVTFTANRLARVMLTVNTIPIREQGTLVFKLLIPEKVTAVATFHVTDLSAQSAAQK
jgi:hypothetical protein